ncbi:MAG: hypothetical protein EOO88_25965 [Pedobacter sp.]|nr:MAG: hypothetical protein EOO88_25965 [Pedobacter sp.]
MQPKKAPKTRRKYDADFKTEVLKMLDSGQTAAYVANALGVSENLIYRWKSVNQVGKKVVAGQSELTTENQQLKERVRQLETEREILKKALSIFSRAT